MSTLQSLTKTQRKLPSWEQTESLLERSPKPTQHISNLDDLPAFFLTHKWYCDPKPNWDYKVRAKHFCFKLPINSASMNHIHFHNIQTSPDSTADQNTSVTATLITNKHPYITNHNSSFPTSSPRVTNAASNTHPSRKPLASYWNQDENKNLLQNNAFHWRRPPASLFGGKKPHIFNHGDDFHDFLLAFENYRTIINIPTEAVFKVFCTFIDRKSLARVSSLNLADKQKADWPLVKEMIIKKLDEKYNMESSVDELFKTQQNPLENVSDFAERLEKIGKNISTCREMQKRIRDKLLKDAFISGLDSKNVAFSLLTTPGINSYAETVQHSFKLEQASEKLRQKPIETETVTQNFAVMNIQETQRCWVCQKVGHLKRDCRNRRFCKYCKMKNHWTHDCKKKKRADQQKIKNAQANNKRQRNSLREQKRIKKEIQSKVKLISHHLEQRNG